MENLKSMTFSLWDLDEKINTTFILWMKYEATSS